LILLYVILKHPLIKERELMKIETVIFDLDGTLIDSLGDIIRAVNKTLAKFKLPELSDDTIGSYVGEGVEILIKRSIGEANLNMFEDALSFYVDTYKEECSKSTVLFPGVLKVLSQLKQNGINIALATNKSIGFTENILKNLAIYDMFDVVMGPENVKNRKPHREVVDVIVKKVGGKLENTLIVGDSKFDILCGKNAGIYTCGVTYGIGTVQSLIEAEADFLISDIEKLLLLC
jgi:phosphoglycolate phosphatase